MKIVFWGLDKPCETTQNMNALIELLICEYPNCKIRIFRKKGSLGGNKQPGKMKRHLPRVHAAPLGRKIEILFYDCGNQMDRTVKKQMREADIVVINMPQRSDAWEDLTFNHVITPERVCFLIGQYFEAAPFNREKIEKIYRIEQERLGIIPYNNEFCYAAESGRLSEFIRNDLGKNEKNQLFQKELKKTLWMILKGEI